jgi:hypothetical protein
LPTIQELYSKHGTDNRLIVLGINLDADQAAARKFITVRKLPWMHGLIGDSSESVVPTSFGISSVPAYFLISPEGKLIEKTYSAEKMAEKIESVLN